MTSTTRCWIDGVDGSLFSLDNLPLGVRSVGTESHVCTRARQTMLLTFTALQMPASLTTPWWTRCRPRRSTR